MNETEKAISEIIGANYGECQCHRETMVQAVKALREKLEREKGCEYCAEGEDLAYGHDSMQRTGKIYLDGNLLTADLYSESMAVAVCFCPMCGKRLEGTP